jgi:hypothetical protein
MASSDECVGMACHAFYNTTNLVVNTTQTTDCTAVSVACQRSGQQLANMVSVYTCHDGDWFPFSPHSCIDDDSMSSRNVGIIIGCLFGAISCLLLTIISIYLLIKNRQQAVVDDQRDMIREEKLRRVWEFTSATAAVHAEIGYNQETSPDITSDPVSVLQRPQASQRRYRAEDLEKSTILASTFDSSLYEWDALQIA